MADGMGETAGHRQHTGNPFRDIWDREREKETEIADAMIFGNIVLVSGYF